jgi:hypothetical protein
MMTHIELFREIVRTNNSRMIDGHRFTTEQAEKVIAFYDSLSSEKNKNFFDEMDARDMAQMSERMISMKNNP